MLLRQNPFLLLGISSPSLILTIEDISLFGTKVTRIKGTRLPVQQRRWFLLIVTLTCPQIVTLRNVIPGAGQSCFLSTTRPFALDVHFSRWQTYECYQGVCRCATRSIALIICKIGTPKNELWTSTVSVIQLPSVRLSEFRTEQGPEKGSSFRLDPAVFPWVCLINRPELDHWLQSTRKMSSIRRHKRILSIWDLWDTRAGSEITSRLEWYKTWSTRIWRAPLRFDGSNKSPDGNKLRCVCLVRRVVKKLLCSRGLVLGGANQI